MDRNPEADRRLMWALVLTMAVMYIWSAFFAPQPQEQAPAQAAQQAAPSDPSASATPASPASAPGAEASADGLIPERTFSVSGDGFSATLDSKGGVLRAVGLNAYTTEPSVTPVWRWAYDRVTGAASAGWEPYTGGGEPSQLLGPQGAIAAAGVGVYDGTVAFNLDRAGRDWVATRALPNGVVITKTFKPGPSPYTMDVQVTFENRGASAVTGLWVGVLGEAHKLADRFDNVMLPVGMTDGDLEHLEDPTELLGASRVDHAGPLSWFGYGNRYFIAALVPRDPAAVRLVFDDGVDGRVGAFAQDDAALAPGQARTLAFTAYVGPKDLDLLEPVGGDLVDSVEFGFFGFFSKVLLFMLELFHRAVGNWGLAVMVLTFTVKLIFFPLTQKSLVSSRRMQQIQPRLKALQEQYKDDPMKQQQETMKLFQENNVNPLGGCLPMLLQLPVWFGLYSCLLYAVQLYNSSFLYLRDLTAADPYAVLPTIAGVLFYVQQAMTPMTGMDPAQQKIMKFMPVIFAVFLYTLPSGLVFYMVVNAVLSIAQTWFLNRTMPAPPAPAT